MHADALPAQAALHQFECGASCNEGAPFAVCVGAAPERHWWPAVEGLLCLDGQWVHGLSLRHMEAFEAACRLASPSVVFIARRDGVAARFSDRVLGRRARRRRETSPRAPYSPVDSRAGKAMEDLKCVNVL